MLIRFYNLGAIEQTEMDLRPLTLIIGPNNSHKTYLAYSVYALWQRIFSQSYFNFFDGYPLQNDDKMCWFLPLSNFTEFIVKRLSFKKIELPDLEGFFQDFGGNFSHTRLGFYPSVREIKELIKKRISGVRIPGNKIVFSFYVKEEVLYVKGEPENDSLDPAKPTEIELNFILSQGIWKALFPTPLSLPAERSGFVLTYKLLSTRRYKLLKELQRGISSSLQSAQSKIAALKEQGYQDYPLPIEAFLDFLMDIETEGHPPRPRGENPFDALADQIEAQIQGHHQVNFHALPTGGKNLRVRVEEGLDIDLYNASSSIKQLTPLILYLRYRAKPNSFLIIDEPELNLHPESQAKLLEAIAVMVNLGVRVLITTHSPYFMNHVNNLISGDTDKPEILQSQAHSLYLKDARAFLSEDQVSAYEMRDFKLCPLKDEDYGIRWDTLSDVSSELQQRYFEIFEKSQDAQES